MEPIANSFFVDNAFEYIKVRHTLFVDNILKNEFF